MTVVLGLTGPVSYDQAAVLVVDGKLISAVEEERFSGVKHHRYGPPVRAANYVLEAGGFEASEVDSVAIGWDSRSSWIKSLPGLYVRRPILSFSLMTQASHLRRYWSLDFLKGFTGRSVYYRHHLAHMASSFFTSGFKKANLLSIDESGETESTVLGVGDGEEITQIKSFDYVDSLGRLYREFTEYLGFIGHSDEYKVMGLSSYGMPIKRQQHLYRVYPGGYTLATRHFMKNLIKPSARKIMSLLKSESKTLDLETYLDYGPARDRDEKINSLHENIAATCQEIYEKILTHLAAALYEQTGVGNFCISGGCGLNCVANGRLLQQPFVKDLFIQPASNDSGSALGAALLEASKTGKVNMRMRDACLGPSYSDEEIHAELDGLQVEYQRHSDIVGVAAEMISEDKIIAWFQDGLEFGPRALGARSIIANPATSKTRDRVNVLKGRELWRPLAPSLLEDCVDKYFEIPHVNDFMTVAQPVKTEMRCEIAGVVHVDGTTRYQSVGRHRDKYHALLTEVGRETGVPVVLNTSFNGPGQPIVRSPTQAVETYRRHRLDGLILGDCLITA